ncbi:MAG: coenzyme F420-0:L-glutamate ligase [Thermoplasmata archaeon]
MEILPLKSKIIVEGDSIPDCIEMALKSNDIQLKDGDIIAVSSKVVAVSEGRIVDYNKIKPVPEAIELAEKYGLEPGFAQLVLEEADLILGGVFRAILTLKQGVFVANAGIDHSNAPPGFAILWPAEPYASAQRIRKKLEETSGLYLGILMCDSHCNPLRTGSAGICIAASGFRAVEDIRGRKDIYGNVLRITRKAVADNLASAAVSVMGESDEITPFVLIRGAYADLGNPQDKNRDNIDSENIKSVFISPEDCLFASLYPASLKKH